MKLSDYKFLKKVLQERLINSNSESEDAQTAIILGDIEGKIAELTLKGNCNYCKKPFDEIDAKTIGSRPDNMCTTCFTSNA